MRFALPELTWMLDLPLWQRDGVRFQVSPREVLGEPERFPHHARRIDEADLSRPDPRDAPRPAAGPCWTARTGSRPRSAVEDTAIDARLVSEADLAAIAR